MAELTCPPLGTGSVDMSALHEAAKKLEKAGKGGDLAEALAAATTRIEPAAEPSAPAPVEEVAAPTEPSA